MLLPTIFGGSICIILHPHQQVVTSDILILAIMSGCVVVTFFLVFICFFLMCNHVQHLFMCILVIPLFFCEVSIQYFPFLKGQNLVVLRCKSSVYVLDSSSCVRSVHYNYFLLVCIFPFDFLSFWWAEGFDFDEAKYIIFLYDKYFCVLSKVFG